MKMMLLTILPVLLMLALVFFHRRLPHWGQVVLVSVAAVMVIWAARLLFLT